MKKILFKPIGIIHSPFTDIKDMPIQPAGAKGVKGYVDVNQEFCEGLDGIEGFSHIILLYFFHLSKNFSLKVKPFMDDNIRGVFATRAPKRPNSIGMSVVKLVKKEKCRLYIENVDIVDGTPLIDIKPFVPVFDCPDTDKIGWLSNRVKKVFNIKSDNRFGG